MQIIGIFGMIAFCGFLGPLSTVFSVLNILLIVFPRYFFSLGIEKFVQSRGKKTNIMDVLIFSFLGFLVQLLFAAYYFHV